MSVAAAASTWPLVAAISVRTALRRNLRRSSTPRLYSTILVFAAQGELLAACQRTGRALGMEEADAATLPRCALQRTIDFALIWPRSADTTLQVASEPPHCEVSVEAYGSCMATCEATVDPSLVEITCEGGEIRGTCDASCQGSCAVDVSGSCGGSCEGTCAGTCAAPTSSGSCAGKSYGTCQGRCVVDAQATCQGECRGGCSVTYREPYCTGRVRRPTASARCRAACDARVEAQARCTPGHMEITVGGGLDAENQARVERVQSCARGRA